MVENNKIYFLADAHLGSAWHAKHSSEHEVERKLCRWFDRAKTDAKAIYLLGDIFDYWFEYKHVVPRGFVRVLGKIAELTDAGIEVHFFIGNHDIWLTDYLEKECGMFIYRQPLVCDINGQKFYLAHGDGLGDDSKSFKIIRALFHSKLCRKLFAAIHPRWAVGFAHKWSNHSRATGGTDDYLGEDREHLVLFAKKHLKIAPHINYFIFGHRHILLDLMLASACRVIILGDWLNCFSYAVFDGQNLALEVFEE
ncbi:MAG: UDP-2,3-diacylglucosamine diphosphatase [Prevotella sp.]|jgi:UDP-2,3-diacylglucosamine hydrolase|nr:UDP-2,3-diacylglucosamine diphosphatase [Prevotella sp.]